MRFLFSLDVIPSLYATFERKPKSKKKQNNGSEKKKMRKKKNLISFIKALLKKNQCVVNKYPTKRGKNKTSLTEIENQVNI